MELFLFDLSKNENGANVVHTAACSNVPAKEQQAFIGPFENSTAAIEAIQTNYPSMNFIACTHCKL